MPNHVSLRMKVTGPKAELVRFKAFVAGKDEDGDTIALAFSKIIPYPEGFDPNVTSGSVTYDIKKGDTKTDEEYAAEMRENAKKHNWQRTDKELEEDIARDLKTRAGARKNLEVSGHPTWYEWNVENWGTKWGAYSIELDEHLDDAAPSLVYDFQTAWSLPEPIFDKLAEDFPKLGISIDVCEEGGFFAGIWKKSKGSTSGHFYEQPYAKTKSDHCPYHGTHDWADDEEAEEEEQDA